MHRSWLPALEGSNCYESESLFNELTSSRFFLVSEAGLFGRTELIRAKFWPRKG